MVDGCSHSALLSLELALLNTGAIRSEMIIDVRVLRCISVLTGCGHAGVHLPPPPHWRKQPASPTSCTSTARAYWLYCSGKQNKSTHLTDLPEQWAPQSPHLFWEDAPFMQESAGDKRHAPLLVSWSRSGTQTFHVIQYQPRGKKGSVQTFWLRIHFSHRLIKLSS